MRPHRPLHSAGRTCAGTAFVAASALLLTACGEAASSPSAEVVIDTLPNGAVHVRSPETGIWSEGERWRLVEETRIGAMDGTGPDVFGNVAALAADAEGRIYVADGQASEVRLFAPDGRHLRTFGREGSGPGEFRQISGMGWGVDGRLWVYDPRNTRFTVIDPEEGFVEDHRRETGFMRFPWPGRIDEYGFVHDFAMVQPPNAPDERVPSVVRFTPEDLSPLDTLSLPPFESQTFDLTDSNGLRRMSATIPFTPVQAWTIAADGDVWIGTSDVYRIHRISRSGDTIRVLERPYTPLPVSRAEREEALERLEWFTQQGGRVDASRIPDAKPAFGQFFEDDRGYLWVAAAVAEGEVRRFDVFDPEGRYLGAVEAPEGLGPMPLPVVRGDRFYAVVRDEFEVPYVVGYRIEGR